MRTCSAMVLPCQPLGGHPHVYKLSSNPLWATAGLPELMKYMEWRFPELWIRLVNWVQEGSAPAVSVLFNCRNITSNLSLQLHLALEAELTVMGRAIRSTFVPQSCGADIGFDELKGSSHTNGSLTAHLTKIVFASTANIAWFLLLSFQRLPSVAMARR